MTANGTVVECNMLGLVLTWSIALSNNTLLGQKCERQSSTGGAGFACQAAMSLLCQRCQKDLATVHGNASIVRSYTKLSIEHTDRRLGSNVIPQESVPSRAMVSGPTAAHLVHSAWLQLAGCSLAGRLNISEGCSCLREPRVMRGFTQ